MKRILAIGLSLAALYANAITLNSKSPVVLPDEPNIQEEYAAKELSTYLTKVFGENVSIVKESTFKGGSAIFLGDTKIAKEQGVGDFDVEEFQISAVPTGVIIAGNRFRGVLYGAYEFLEQFAGVRFFSPECEIVPSHTNLTVEDGTAIRHKPAFIFRSIYPGGGFIGWPQSFTPKFRCNADNNPPELGGGNHYGKGGSCHTYYHYSKSFPKEISWMNSRGERIVVNDPFKGSICFSQPEVLKRFSERLKSLIAEDRKAFEEKGCPPPVIYAVQQNDCNATCFCPECIAFKEKHGLSGLVIDFTNKLADSIKDEYPDVFILIFAYFDTLEPPKTDIRPRKNVLPQITTYTKTFHDHLRAIDDPVNKGASELFDRWASISESLAMWDYWRYYGGFLPPGTPVKNLSGMIRKYRDCNVILYFTEYEVSNKTILSFFDLTCYVGFKLLDHPESNADTLIDEFMAGYYGAASVPMRKYLDHLTEKFAECGPINEERVAFTNRKYLNDKEFYSKGLELIADAEKAVDGNETQLKRIHIEKLLLTASYIKVLAKKGNPLGLDIEALKAQIPALCDDTASVLLNPKQKTPKMREEMANYYADINSLKPTQNYSAKPMDNIPAEGAIVYDFKGTQCTNFSVEDSDAPDGNAYSLASSWTPEENLKKHNKGFLFGMYEQSNAHYVATASLPGAAAPQDEKYHWYYAGNTPLYPRLILYCHWTWMLSVKLGKYYNNNDPNQSYDIYFLLKLQGPAYVKGSTKTNDVRLARVAFVKK